MQLKEALQFIEQKGDHIEEIKILTNKLHVEQPEMAKPIYEALLNHAEAHQFEGIYPWLLYNAAWVEYDLGEVKEAIRGIEKAQRLFEENDDIDGVITTLTSLVGMYAMQNAFNQSIASGKRGLELAEGIGAYDKISSIKNNMAVTYIEMEEYESAKGILEQIEQMPMVTTKKNQVIYYTNLAQCETALHQGEKALYYLEKAWEFATASNMNFAPGVLYQYGITYTELGLYQEADEKFKESVKMCQDRSLMVFLYEALLFWSDLDLKMGRYEEGILKLKEIEAHIESVQSARNIKRLYENLKAAYECLGDYKKAYEYSNKLRVVEVQATRQSDAAYIEYLNEIKKVEEEKVYKTLYHQTEALYSLGLKMTSSLRREDIQDVIADEIRDLLECETLFIARIKNEHLVYELCIDHGERVMLEPIPLCSKTIGAYCIRQKQEVLIRDIYKDYPKYIMDLQGYIEYIEQDKSKALSKVPGSMIFVPIMVENEVIGIISAQSYQKNAFDVKDVTTLKVLSTYLAIALENARLYKEVEYWATYDALTRVLNRKEALKRIQLQYEAAQKTDQIYYIMMLDVDDFKKINDTYGHQIGDQVLVQVARAIEVCVPAHSVIGRYGGEEFIMVIDDACDYYQVAEAIRACVTTLEVRDEMDGLIKMTVSIGCAPMLTKDCSLHECIGMSDKALYEAKNTGKNKVVVYSKSANR